MDNPGFIRYDGQEEEEEYNGHRRGRNMSHVSSDQAFVDDHITSSSSSSSLSYGRHSTVTETQPININRPIFYTEDFYQKKNPHHGRQTKQQHHQQPEKLSFDRKSNRCCCCYCPTARSLAGSVARRLLPARTEPLPGAETPKSIGVQWLQTLFPICQWLANYQFRRDLLSDVVAGTTILALHIPQGLAYGKLAGVQPINGLYVSLFPVIIYAIFGTGRQVSIGTFAVISIACNDALEAFDLNHDIVFRTTEMDQSPLDQPLPSGIEVLTALCLMVGVLQFLLGFLQLGIFSIILSETLISAFVTACSIHVFTSQIFALADVDSAVNEEDDIRLPIPFDIVHTYIRFISRLKHANLVTLALSAICIAILVGCKYGLQPWIVKRFRLKNLVIPIDILVIVLATVISELADLNGVHGVHVIPKIPKAFEGMPQVPQVSRFFPRLYGAAILITVVSFVSTYSLGKIYAKQHGYEVSANQELIALGAANLFSSFFLCYPCSGSLARSAVMDKVGARTQLASLVSSILMVLFLLFFSGYLRALPKAVLSCIIIVALYSTMRQIKEAKTAWHASWLDGILWVATFLLVILFGVGHGLLYSVLFSFFILIVRLSIPIIKLKQQVKGSDVFVEINNQDVGDDDYDAEQRQQHSMEPATSSATAILEFQGPLLFINAVLLKNRFHSVLGRFFRQQRNRNQRETETGSTIPIIILDCTRMTYVDRKGAETLLDMAQLCHNHRGQFLLAACSQAVYDSLRRNDFFKHFNQRYCFMSVIDAIADSEQQCLSQTPPPPTLQQH